MEEKVIKNEIVLFENQDVKLEVNMKDETVWLNANQMSELFGRDSKTIRKHIDKVINGTMKPIYKHKIYYIYYVYITSTYTMDI